jgi:hypothetical protein
MSTTGYDLTITENSEKINTLLKKGDIMVNDNRHGVITFTNVYDDLTFTIRYNVENGNTISISFPAIFQQENDNWRWIFAKFLNHATTPVKYITLEC